MCGFFFFFLPKRSSKRVVSSSACSRPSSVRSSWVELSARALPGAGLQEGAAHPTKQTTSQWPRTKGRDSANALFEWVSLMGKNCRYLIALFEPTTKADSRKWKSELCTVLKARNQAFSSVVLYCAHIKGCREAESRTSNSSRRLEDAFEVFPSAPSATRPFPQPLRFLSCHRLDGAKPGRPSAGCRLQRPFSARPGLARPGSTRLGPARPSSARLGPARPGPARRHESVQGAP